jgi:hypothetical protein
MGDTMKEELFLVRERAGAKRWVCSTWSGINLTYYLQHALAFNKEAAEFARDQGDDLVIVSGTVITSDLNAAIANAYKDIEKLKRLRGDTQ